MIPLTHLRRVAEAATPGPWEWFDATKKGDLFPGENGLRKVGGESYKDTVLSGDAVGAAGDGWVNASDEDKAFIATFNPALVSLLLDVAEAAERVANVKQPTNPYGRGGSERPLERELTAKLWLACWGERPLELSPGLYATDSWRLWRLDGEETQRPDTEEEPKATDSDDGRRTAYS